MKNLNAFFFMALAWMLAGTSVGQTQGDLPAPTAVNIAGGMSSPTVITHAGDERIFVALQPGTIEIMYRDGSVEASPFLDITDRVYDSGSEQGLLGLAFPPDYCTSGYFYVNYIYRTGGQNYTRISRFSVDAENANFGDESSEEVLLQFSQPYSNHNGGHLEFGGDGMLYVASGDGGSGGDPNNYAQNPTLLLGKILRLDVSEVPGYVIPEDNPFVFATGVLDEIWAIGMRNPWKFAFDSETGDLYIADVGQNAWEEINFEPAGSIGGRNYGWRCYEGTHTYDFSECETSVTYEMPVFEYPHQSGRCSVTGGRVYRGPSFAAMTGRYFFTDLCSGEFWSIRQVDGQWTSENYGSLSTSSVTTFGSDVWGEMYFATGSGTVYRLEDENGELIGPIDFVDGNTLTSTLEGVDYQWQLNGEAIGESTQSIEISENGVYALVVVTESGCEVDAGEFEVTQVGLADREGSKLKFNIHPNPGGDRSIRVEWDGPELGGDARLEFLEPAGRKVRSVALNGGQMGASGLAGLAPGLYIVLLEVDGKVVGVSKFVRE